ARKSYPRASPNAQFTPWDFDDVIAHLPDDCSLVGGQAVAWWANHYGIKVRVGDRESNVTSNDIDFWGERSDLVELAKQLRHRPIFPHEYEMTVWVGAFQITIRDQQSVVEFLHTVPGLDTNNPDDACVEQIYLGKSVKKNILVLSPVSLVLAKLHALRHFDQKTRHDEQHLKVSIETSKRFIIESLESRHAKEVLWNCQRLINCHQLKSTRRLEAQHQFNILDAIPIGEIQRESKNPWATRRRSRKTHKVLDRPMASGVRRQPRPGRC
ncbi:MAG TPA: hypothetical protein VGN61_16150, partial [Verrucomicrobiae bacterium]